MELKNKLKDLHNAMSQVETKGDSTLMMSDCLRYLNQVIQECDKYEEKKEKSETNKEVVS